MSEQSKNPVHQVTQKQIDLNPDNSDVKSPGWYFWDETWSSRQGPFTTENLANLALNKYTEAL